MSTNPILDWFNRRRDEREQYEMADLPSGPPTSVDERVFPSIYTLPTAPDRALTASIPLERARDAWVRAVHDYRSLHEPDHVLLGVLPAGMGKTYLTLAAMALLASRGDNVAWLTPRHAMWAQLVGEAEKQGIPPHLMFHWLARSGADADGEAMCKHDLAMTEYLYRGGGAYKAIDFCVHVRDCGREYVQTGCRYHGQQLQAATQAAQILIGQHMHLFVGHPMWEQFNVLVGDENPMSAAQRRWSIPHGAIVPSGGARDPAMQSVLERLAELAKSGQRVHGPTLVHDLAARAGGIDRLIQACERSIGTGVAMKQPIHNPEQVHTLDYFHLHNLATELRREAQAVVDGVDYAPRVEVATMDDGGARPMGGLHIYLKHRPTWKPRNAPFDAGWPRHAIWLDATGAGADGNLRYYEAIFGRPVVPVRIDVAQSAFVVQVYDRQNEKSRLFMSAKDTAERTEKGLRVPESGLSVSGDRLVEQVDHVSTTYRARGKTVGIIAYKSLVATGRLNALASRHPTTGEPMIGWFGAERGSNAMKDVDCLIVAGTPQPPPDDLHNLARCLYHERDEAFTVNGGLVRTEVETSYSFRASDGTGRGYNKRVYADADVAALHWQLREGELIQSFHRARPILRDPDHPVHIYLLTNLPVPEIAVDELVSIHELLQAPPDVDEMRWRKVIEYANFAAQAAGYITPSDLVRAIGCTRSSAGTYLDRLLRYFPGEWHEPAPDERVLVARMVTGGGRGRPPSKILIARKDDGE